MQFGEGFSQVSGEEDSNAVLFPGPFSFYKMQQRLNENCKCAQISASFEGFIPQSWEQV